MGHGHLRVQNKYKATWVVKFPFCAVRSTTLVLQVAQSVLQFAKVPVKPSFSLVRRNTFVVQVVKFESQVPRFVSQVPKFVSQQPSKFDLQAAKFALQEPSGAKNETDMT
ncbi:unnamed protein product [Mortierella alpina]